MSPISEGGHLSSVSSLSGIYDSIAKNAVY